MARARGTSLGGNQSRAEKPTSPNHVYPIHGDFIPVSGSPESCPPFRRNSPSPVRLPTRSPQRRRQVDRGVHLHLSLTDSQMDKLTSTFSTGSPKQKPCRREAAWSDDDSIPGSPATMPQFKDPFERRLLDAGRGRTQARPRADGHAAEATRFDDFSPRSRSSSPTKRQRSPVKKDYVLSPSSTGGSFSSTEQQRKGARPSPINVKLAQKLGSAPRRGPKLIPVHSPDPPGPAQQPQTPASNRGLRREARDDHLDSSSVYSGEGDTSYRDMISRVSPLRINKNTGAGLESDPERRPSVLQNYTEWTKSADRGNSGVSASPRTHRREGAVEGDANPDVGKEEARIGGRGVYSPFAPFLEGSERLAARKGRKVMVGYNGWLERTGKTPDKKVSPPKRGTGILDALKKVAKEVVEMSDMKATRRAKELERGRHTSRLMISLDPREQSLMYCEMEFILTSALDSYINSQFNAGRLDADKYKRVVDGWQQKGRPRVVGFRYDLETQLDLVHLHIHHFKFYGDRSGVPGTITGVLDMMKVNSRAMRIRTFCQPDSVVAKQLLDSQSLFNILGCPEQQQIQLAEIIQFFKTILERERHFHADTGSHGLADDDSTRP